MQTAFDQLVHKAQQAKLTM